MTTRPARALRRYRNARKVFLLVAADYRLGRVSRAWLRGTAEVALSYRKDWLKGG